MLMQYQNHVVERIVKQITVIGKITADFLMYLFLMCILLSAVCIQWNIRDANCIKWNESR